jgi:uncharacterized protein (TIGR00251 family)
MSVVKTISEGVLLKVKVTPNAGRDEITGVENGMLCVRLTATPEKGKANERLIGLLAKMVKMPKSRLSLKNGQTSRVKQIIFEGISEKDLSERLHLEG